MVHSCTEIDDLAAAVDAVLALRPVGELACGEALLGLLRERDRLDAAIHRLARLAEVAGTAPADGAASMAAWLRWRARLAPGEAVSISRTARRLSEVPEVAKAFAAGEVSGRHVRAVTDLLADVPADAVRLAEPALLEVACDYDPRFVQQAASRVREAAFPDGTAEARRRLEAGRFVTLTKGFGGGFDLTGWLTPEAAATLHAALAPLLVPAGPADDRTVAQRRHDGLAALARLALATSELPATGGDRPRLVVTIDAAALGQDGGAETTAELGWGGRLDSEALRRLGCDAELVRVVLDGAGEVIDLGRATRLPTAAQRRALAARDGGCAFPGCDRPPPWCQAHHLVHWIDGGPTDLANLVLLCGFHHHLLHEAKWALAKDGEGGWTATAPDRRNFHRHRRRRASA